MIIFIFNYLISPLVIILAIIITQPQDLILLFSQFNLHNLPLLLLRYHYYYHYHYFIPLVLINPDNLHLGLQYLITIVQLLCYFRCQVLNYL